MQPLIKAALLCDYALTGADGKLSALGIFNNINFPNLPNAYPLFFAVIILALDSGTHPIQLGIVDPMGQQVLPESPSVDVPVEVAGAEANLVIGFPTVQFNRPGIYQVQLFVDGLLCQSIPLTIQTVPSEGFPPARPN